MNDKELIERAEALFKEFAIVETEYAQPNNDIDVGEMYYYASKFEAVAQCLLTAYKALREAVIVLPDDAEPMVGDIILDYDNEPRLVARNDGCRVLWATDEGYDYCYIGQVKIIQRNGLSAIKESTLKGAI